MGHSTSGHVDQPLQHCSFCKKDKHEVQKLIAGPSVCICNECVQLCTQIIQEAIAQEKSGIKNDVHPRTPWEIGAELDKSVIGQNLAKRTLAVAAYNHFKRVELLQKGQLHPLNAQDETELAKSNILMIGPTGCGKTLLAKALARVLNLPFTIVDATTLTEAGYVGEDVENILQRLLQAADGDVSRAQMGIVYLDEIDKLSRRGDNPSITRDVSGEGVQQCLLKLLEGTIASVPLQGSRKHPNQETVLIDTTNILFICGGTFAGLDKIIRERTERAGIGFSAHIRTQSDKENELDYLSRLETGDLVKYGLIPELIGRLPVIVGLEALNEEALIKVLKEPKNALIRQYAKLFRADKIELEFLEEALLAIAQKALSRKTGARSLRAILENSLLDVMYNLPSMPEISKVVIDAASIHGKSTPRLIYKKKQANSKLAVASNE